LLLFKYVNELTACCQIPPVYVFWYVAVELKIVIADEELSIVYW
jgi:hypothetical protein